MFSIVSQFLYHLIVTEKANLCKSRKTNTSGCSLLAALGFVSFITWCLSGSVRVHRAGHVAMLITDLVFFSKRPEGIVSVSSLNGWPYLHYQHIQREFLSSTDCISFPFLSQGAWYKWMAKHRISVWCYQLFEFAGSLWSTTDCIKRY